MCRLDIYTNLFQYKIIYVNNLSTKEKKAEKNSRVFSTKKNCWWQAGFEQKKN